MVTDGTISILCKIAYAEIFEFWFHRLFSKYIQPFIHIKGLL